MDLSDKQINENRREIVRLLISTQREGVESVIDYLYNSGFFIVPSSRKRHHCWKGGLAQHSLSVCKLALSLDTELPRSSIILCGLLHDICKATKLYYDDKGNLHHRTTYIPGHGRRSIKLLEKLNFKLSEDERRAIRWHMGGHYASEDEIADLEIAKQSKLWKIIHKADVKDAVYSQSRQTGL